MTNLIWIVIAILFVLWLLGLAVKIGGKLIHIALVVGLILLVYNLLVK